jgi:asparagine synthase (glutamine-hydrolysing)
MAEVRLGFICGMVRLGEAPLPRREAGLAMARALWHRSHSTDAAEHYADPDVFVMCGGASLLRVDGLLIALDGYLTEGVGPEDQASGSRAAFRGLSREPDQLLGRVRGGFALAAYEPARKRLLLARDHAGTRPVLYTTAGDTLLFASEAKAFFASGLVEPRVDVTALQQVLDLWFPLPPRTLFEGVRTLAPAHLLETARGRSSPTIRRYWRAPFGANRAPRRAAEEVLGVIEGAIDRHVSDLRGSARGRVASYLSSGLDSALVTALLSRTMHSRLLTLTVGSTQPAFDERPVANELARNWGTEHHCLTFQRDSAGGVVDLVWHCEQPLVAPSLGSAFAASRTLRDLGAAVVFTGDGADELLAGHECHRQERVRRLLARTGLPGWLGRRWPRLGGPYGSGEFVHALLHPDHSEVARGYGGLYPPWYPSWRAVGILREVLPVRAAPHPPHQAPAEWHTLLRPDLADMNPLDAALSVEFETKLPQWNLAFAERGAAAHGIQARIPLLDREVIECLASLTTSHKLGWWRDKAVLRAASRRLLPPIVWRRNKRTPSGQFQVPLFGAASEERVRHLLSEPVIRNAGLLRWPAIRRLLVLRDLAGHGSFLRTRCESALSLCLSVSALHELFVVERRFASAPASLAHLQLPEKQEPERRP